MMVRTLKSLLADRTGGTAVEYGLLLTLIAVALLTGLEAFSGSLGNVFNTVANNMAVPDQ